MDVNDNPPVFSEPSGIYRARLSETSAPGSVVTTSMALSDADADQNAKLKVECVREEGEEGCDVFDVEEQVCGADLSFLHHLREYHQL